MRKNGFSFIELLIAMVIVTIGIGSLVVAFSTAMTAGLSVKQSATALFLANEQMEAMRVSYASAVVSPLTNLGGNFADFSRQVTVTAAAANLQEVHVIVSWTYKGATDSIDMVSLFANYAY